MFLQPTKIKGKATDFPLCFMNKHEPDRRAAKWDGTGYVSHCLNCGKRIRRKSRNNWKRETTEAAPASKRNSA